MGWGKGDIPVLERQAVRYDSERRRRRRSVHVGGSWPVCKEPWGKLAEPKDRPELLLANALGTRAAAAL